MLSDNNLDELKKYGFTIIRNFANLVALKKLDREIYSLAHINKNISISSGKDFNWLNVDGDYILSSAHNLHNYKSSFSQFILDQKSFEVFEDYYSCKASIHSNASYFAKPEHVGLETLSHQDMAFFNLKKSCILTFWIAIDPSNKENGGIFYLKENRRSELIEHFARGNLGASMCISEANIDTSNIYCPEVNPGDCIIHDPYVVHGSYPNRSANKRRSINYTLTSEDNEINMKQHSNYLNELEKFLKAKKK